MFISQRDAQNIVNEMKASIHRDINIMDETGTIIASTNPARCGQSHQGAIQIIQNQLSSLLIRENDPERGVQSGINLPIMFHDKLIGVIGITGDPEEVSIFGDIIKRMTEVMVERIKQQEQKDLIDRAKGLFIENWLFSDQIDWGELELRGRLLGIDIAAPYTVVLLHLPSSSKDDLDEIRSSRILSTIQASIQSEKKHYCAVIHNKIILLLHQCSRETAGSIVRKVCQTVEGYYQLKICGGISSASQSPKDIRRCYLEAQMAETIARESSQSQVVFYDESSFEFVVGSIPQSIRQNLREMVFASCSPAEREEFAQLIQLYFHQNGNINACAEHLFVHRNTIQYRMDQIRKKTCYDLRHVKDAFLLYSASYEETVLS